MLCINFNGKVVMLSDADLHIRLDALMLSYSDGLKAIEFTTGISGIFTSLKAGIQIQSSVRGRSGTNAEQLLQEFDQVMNRTLTELRSGIDADVEKLTDLKRWLTVASFLLDEGGTRTLKDRSSLVFDTLGLKDKEVRNMAHVADAVGLPEEVAKIIFIGTEGYTVDRIESLLDLLKY